MPDNKNIKNKNNEFPILPIGSSFYAKRKRDLSNMQIESVDKVANAMMRNRRFIAPLQNLDESYTSRGIYPNIIDTQADYDRQRAESQSAIEQLSNMAVQLVGNEVVLGMALGVSNLVDMAVNIGKDEGEDNYTNPVSLAIENIQNDIRNRFAIYQRDPNAAFALGDLGWWANNAVSVGSTLSLMLPSMGIAKGLSMLGRVGNAGRRASKFLAKASKFKNPVGTDKIRGLASRVRSIEEGIKIGTTALLSRTMENYQEAREVYNHTHERVLDRLKNMTEEERVEFIRTNPDFKDKDDETIANIIANRSADVTFRNDYAMLLFDMMQFKGIMGIKKLGMPAKNTPTSARIRIENRNAAKRLLGVTEDKLEDVGFISRQKEAFRYLIANPAKSLYNTALGLELSEGIEEGFQGIQSEKGKEVLEKTFDKRFTERDIVSYLTDPHIYEQAMWGVIGAKVFQWAGKQYKKGEDYLKYRKYKDKLQNEGEFNWLMSGEEKIKTREIEQRLALAEAFKNKMQNIANGKDPYNYKIDEDGNIIESDGVKEYEDLLEEDKSIVEAKTIDDYVTEMALNAADAGNYDLLKEYLTSPEFDKYLKDTGIGTTSQSKSLSNTLIQRMDEIYNNYMSNVMNVMDNVDDLDNEYVVKLQARDITRAKLFIESIDDKLQDLKNRLYGENTNNSIINNYLNSERLLKTKEKVDKLLNERNSLEDLLKKNIISLTYKGQRTDEIDNEIHNLLNNLHEIINFDNKNYNYNIDNNTIEGYDKNVYTRSNELNNYIKNEKELDKKREDKDKVFNILSNRLPSKAQQDLAKLTIAFEQAKIKQEEYIPKNHNEYQKQYNEIAIKVDKLAKKKIDDSVKLVTDWLNEQEDLDEAKRQLYQEEDSLSRELKDALFALKLGSIDRRNYQRQIEKHIEDLKQNRETQERKNKVASANGLLNTKSKTEEQIGTQTNIENKENKEETTAQNKLTNENEINHFTGGVQNESEEKIDETIPIDVENQAINANVEENLTEEEIAEEIKHIYDLIIKKITNFIHGVKDENYNELFDIIAENPKEYTEENINKFINDIYNYLVKQDVNKNVLKENFKDVIKSGIGILRRRNKIKSTSKIENIEEFYFAMRQFHNEMFSVLDEIETDAIEKLENNIKDYLGLEYKEDFKEETEIDIEDFFDYLIYNKHIPINDAVNTFKLIIHTYESLELNNIKFEYLKSDNVKLKLLENRNKFIQEIINNNAYKEALEHNFHMNKARENKEPIKEGTKFTISRNGNSITAIDENGLEIMYISTVEKTKNNNEFKLSSKTASGFLYEVGKNNGEVYSNLDEFFENLINDKELFEFFKRQFTGVEAKKGDLEFGLPQHILIKELESKLQEEKIGLKITIKNSEGNFRYKEDLNSDEDKLNFLINKINNILFFGATSKKREIVLNYTPQQRINSVKNWIKNVYNNYEKTNEIQERLEKNNNKIQGKVTGIQGNLKIYNDSRDIKDSGLNNSYPIIAVNTQNNLVSESSNVSYTSNHRYKIGTMGMLVQDNPNAPLIAMFTSANKLDKNSELTKALKEELRYIITEYLNNNDDIDFNTLTKKLIALIGSGPNNLFRGINVIEHEGILYLNVVGDENKYVAKIYSSDRYIDNIDENAKYRIKGSYKNAKTLIDNLVNSIIDKLVFNRTLYFINHKQEHNHDVSGYYGKEKGKLFINFGGKKIIYDSFSDFIIKNNAFKTNTYASKGKSVISYITEKGGDIFVSLDNTSLPVEEQNKEEAIQVIENPIVVDPSQPKTRATDYILYNFGYEQTNIDLLLGKGTGIDLLPKTFYFDETDETNNAYYLIKGNKETIALTKRGLENIKNSSYDGKNLFIQYLLHENIHKKFKEKGLRERKDIIDGLIETYNEFIEYINKDDSAEGIALKEWIEKNDFNIDGYFKKNYPNNEFTEEEKRLIFAEEWLCESLSRSRLTNYLNEAISDNKNIIVDNIQEEQKSIWQKIIDLLLKLFGKSTKNIKNNSILAEQYRLLSETIDNSKNDIVEENTIIEEENKKIEQDISTSDWVLEDEDDDSDFGEQNLSVLGEISEIENEYEQELLDIKNKAIANGTFMKAPNGNPTNLTERQWLQVRTKEFINWFGDWINDPENASKVVDENGEPLVVYHGNRTKNKIKEFEYNKIGSEHNPLLFGFWFIDDYDIAKYEYSINYKYTDNGRKEEHGEVLPVFLNIKNPIIKKQKNIRIEDSPYGNMPIANETFKDFLNNINKQFEEDYDGAILTLIDSNGLADPFYESIQNQYVVKYANQIKSATDNIGTFSTTNNDIRYSTTTEIEDINLNGTTHVTNMNRYLDNFNEQDKAIISRNLDNGNISFYCR